jgi:NAD(P)-dependent dehydrogenase (short-subunit alcohol dehydrogenase family)
MEYKGLVGGLMDLSLSYGWRPLIRSSLCSGLACRRLARRNYSQLDDTAAQLTSAADQIVAIPDDATDPVAAAEIVTKVEQQLGPITLLISNAGQLLAFALIGTVESCCMVE